MRTPRLRQVSASSQSCADFGGIDRTPDAPMGRWADARNLSFDYSPTIMCRNSPISARDDRESDGIPGDFTKRIVAMCGGNNPVFCDMYGTFFCGSSHVSLGRIKRLRWSITFGDAGELVTPILQQSIGQIEISDYETETFPAKSVVPSDQLELLLDGWQDEIRIRFDCIGRDREDMDFYRITVGEQFDDLYGTDIASYGIPITFVNNTENQNPYYDRPPGGFWLEIAFAVETDFNQKPVQLIQHGAYLIAFPAGIAVNLVRLESGQPIRDEDIFEIPLEREIIQGQNEHATICMCRKDGSEYDSGEIIESSAAPDDHTKLWLNTTTDGSAGGLYEWLDSVSMWSRVQSTFVKINKIQAQVRHTIPDSVSYLSEIREGDVLKFTATYLPDFSPPDIVELLSGAHKIEAVLPEEGAIVIPGVLSEVSLTTTAHWTVERRLPDMDFVVSAENRLWGCRYSILDGINELYASALGDPRNWEVYQGISTDAWRASRGTAAPYTGAAVLEGKPLFFREDFLDKVYPSATGAHQVQEFTIDGVEQGAHNSLCVIDNRLYYKSRLGIMVYTGTYPACISGRLGDMQFSGGSAGRHGKLYCMSTKLSRSARGYDRDDWLTVVYDTESGEWQMWDDFWTAPAVTHKDRLLYIREDSTEKNRDVFFLEDKELTYDTEWYAETAPQAIHYMSSSGRGSVTEHKFVSYVRIRLKIPGEVLPYIPPEVNIQPLSRSGMRLPGEPGGRSSALRVYLSYDEDRFILKRSLTKSAGTRLHTIEIPITPNRRDNFRLRLEGLGPVQIFDINYRMERSEGGH